MKKTFKIIVALLSFCLLISSNALSVCADDNANENTSDIKVAWIGDSICNGYRNYFNFEGTIPTNFGINQNTTNDVLKRISDVYGDYDKLVIICGINDFGRNTSKDETFSKSMNNYKSIFESVHENVPDMQIYVTGVFPTCGDFDYKMEFCPIYNEKLKTLCDEYCYVTYMPECWDVLYDSQTGLKKIEYKSDGLHLNQKAYTALSEVIKPYIYENKVVGDVYYQKSNNSPTLRFIAEMNVDDVFKVDSGHYQITLNGNISKPVEILKAFDAIKYNGRVQKASKGKCFVVTKAINCNLGDKFNASFSLSGFDKGLNRAVTIYE